LFNKKIKKAWVGQSVLIWPSILVLLGLIVYPLGTILLQSIFPGLFDHGFSTFSTQSFVLSFKGSYTYHAILNAFLFGCGTAIIAAVLGTFFAVLVHRKWVYGQKFADLVIWLVFFTPSYLIAEGWVLMMQDKGVISVLFQLPNGSFSWFFTPYGLVFAMAFRLFPVVYLSVKAGLQRLGSDFEDAARTQGASSFFVWTKIVVPLLMPAILGGATLTFAESASDFGFAAAFVPKAHIPMLTYSIYTALGQMPVDYSQVGALSFVLIAIIGLAIWSQKLILSRGSYSIIQNQIRPFRVDYKPSIFWSACAYGILFLVFAVPIGGEAATSFMTNSSLGFTASNISLEHYKNVLTGDNGALQSILRSLKLSIGTSLTVTLLGIVLAYVINKKQNIPTKILFVLTMSTLAIPGIILAAGYIFAWNAPFLVPFHLNVYGTFLCLFLAYVAGALPNSIRLQMAALIQISPSLVNAGRIHGASNFTIFQKILIPLVASTTISVLFLTFSHIMFELPASELLYPPGQEVLPVLVAHHYTEFQMEDGAALTVVSIFIVLSIYGIGQWMIFIWRKSQKVILMRLINSKKELLQNPNFKRTGSE
jgi:iron(III) transport system permease protein